jgi:hypothetical protein
VHGSEFGTNVQPDERSQSSWVHGFSSSQRMRSPSHAPSRHESPLVHALPSSQLAVLFSCAQPSAPSQRSSVQGFPSSQPAGTHAPPQQRSVPPQSESRTHTPAMHVALSQALPTQVAGEQSPYWQPATGSQRPPAISVQAASSGVLAQTPASHRSTVHATPSSHDPAHDGPASRRGPDASTLPESV